jgi:DNA primase
MKWIYQDGHTIMISDFDTLSSIFNADKWLEDYFGCEFYKGNNGFLNSSCPFDDHIDTSPSFGINMEKGFFKCFGCGREGSLIELVRLLMGVSFHQAVNVIATYENLNLDNLDTLTFKTNKFKRIIEEQDTQEAKNKKIIDKATIKIKKIMNTDFEKAESLFKELDKLKEEENYKQIKEMFNGIA